jgi:hypothetical protein
VRVDCRSAGLREAMERTMCTRFHPGRVDTDCHSAWGRSYSEDVQGFIGFAGGRFPAYWPCLFGTAVALCKCEGERQNVCKGSEGLHAGSFDHINDLSISPAQHAESTAFADAIGCGPSRSRWADPPALRQRRIVFLATLPSSQNSSRPGSTFPGPFFLLPA